LNYSKNLTRSDQGLDGHSTLLNLLDHSVQVIHHYAEFSAPSIRQYDGGHAAL
jgi:hypothetical protein